MIGEEKSTNDKCADDVNVKCNCSIKHIIRFLYNFFFFCTFKQNVNFRGRVILKKNLIFSNLSSFIYFLNKIFNHKSRRIKRKNFHCQKEKKKKKKNQRKKHFQERFLKTIKSVFNNN